MPASPAFAAEPLTVVSWGGAYQAALRKAVFEPFTKTTGINITEGEWNGEMAKVRAMVSTRSVSWDVVEFSPAQTLQGCAEGMLDKIDWKKLGLDQRKFISGEKYDCGVQTLVGATVITYDRDKLPNGPKTIADLFDTKKF